MGDDQVAEAVAVELNTVVAEPGALAAGKSGAERVAAEAAVVPVAVAGNLILTDLVSRQQAA